MPQHNSDNRRSGTSATASATARGHDPIITDMSLDNGLPRLNERQLAKRWGVSVRTLQAARVKGSGVPFVRIGRSVRYRLEDVLAYERAGLRNSTSD
jgi:hypothetical protein